MNCQFCVLEMSAIFRDMDEIRLPQKVSNRMRHVMRKETFPISLIIGDLSSACMQALSRTRVVALWSFLIYEPCHEKTCLCHMRTTKAQSDPFSLISTFVVRCLDSTLNETYNRPPYILATGSGNQILWLKIVSCIHKEAPCQNSLSYFISIGRLLLAHAQS